MTLTNSFFRSLFGQTASFAQEVGITKHARKFASESILQIGVRAILVSAKTLAVAVVHEIAKVSISNTITSFAVQDEIGKLFGGI